MRRSLDEIALEAFAVATQDQTETIIVRALTTNEKVTVGRRLLLAQAVLAGKTRAEINQQIRVSPNTYAQINRWLETEFAEYATRVTVTSKSRKHVSRHVRPFSYEHLKKKYPMHFLLFTLAEELWKSK